MELLTYHDIIYRTINTNCSGYGYVEAFANALNSHHEELCIGNILLFLQINLNGTTKEWTIFVDDRKFNANSFKLIDLAKQNRVIDSSRENIGAFKNSNEFGDFHVVAFPIHPKPTKELLMDVYGVVLLLSYTKIGLTSSDQESLYEILSSQQPRTIGSPQVNKAIKLLVSTDGKMSDISLKDRHIMLSQALDIISNKGDEKNNRNGLRHFSFWSSNNIQKGDLCKEFNKNTYSDFCHDITYRVLEDQHHFILDYFDYYKKNEGRPFSDLIKLFNFDDVGSSLKKLEEYFFQIGLTKDNISVVIVPLKFDPHISFCCFYIKDIVFTPFVSVTLFKKIVEAVRQRINLINEINIKNMLDEMMSASFKFSKSTEYFQKITEILKKSNEAEDCLIYMRDDANDRFLLVSEEDENNTSSLYESNISFEDHEFFLPGKYYANDFIKQSLFQALQTKSSICSYPENKGTITSACIIIIKDAEDQLCGFILLVNKNHEVHDASLFFNELFFYNNIYITESCSKYITLYLNGVHSNNRKVKLLKKLRHEIPDCTHVIDVNMNEIISNVENRGYRTGKFISKAKEILINSRRIDNIASFFSTLDFDDSRFLENPSPFNMRDFMNERLDIFREEAAYRGVYIRCNIEANTPALMVSDYYLHAVNNIITNAIRYAAPGTCIWIRSDSDKISVSDVGIEVKDSETNKIFKEGYRSMAAKDENEQGMGYGLYLAKRVLDAYGHSIMVKCEKVHDRNLYAERLVSERLSMYSAEERKAYVLRDTFPHEEVEVWRRVNFIKGSDSHILPQFRPFINYDEFSTSIWFEYHNLFGPTFYVMEDDCFNIPIYNVTFTIKFF